MLDVHEHIGPVELMDEGLQDRRADRALSDEGADARVRRTDVGRGARVG